ncbi:MAG: class I SAM-dependent methyltransferase [Nitrospirae bacterium]|nr:class I SAM-dependent methyltransferase [Nitrospirota bacterium]
MEIKTGAAQMQNGCYLCSAGNLTHVKEHHFYYEKDDTFRIFNYYFCRNCGFVSVYPQTDSGFLKEFYSTYSDLTDTSEIERTQEVMRYLKGYASVIGLNEKSRIIDVGSGDGHLIHFLSMEGLGMVYGVEPSAPRRDRSGKAYGLSNLYRSLEEVPDNIRFDLLVCAHVIEHVVDPLSFVKKLSSLLNEEGAMYIELPGYLTDRKQFPDMVFSHLSCFSLRSLHEMLNRSGLTVISGEHYTGLSVPVLRVLAKKGRVDAPSASKENVEDLFKSVVEREKMYWEFIRNAAERVSHNSSKGIKTVIWPSGTDTRELLFLTGDKLDKKYVLLVDSDASKHEKKIAGFQINQPDSIKTFCDAESEIVICSAYSNTRESIIDDIRKLYPVLSEKIIVF